MKVVKNENSELILTRTITGERMCIDYRRLNDAITEDHFSLPFIDYMIKKLAGCGCYCFLDGKEFFAVVFSFDKFKSYLVGSKAIVHTNHLTLK